MATMIRKLNGHKVNPANDTLEIEVLDSPGAGGANHFYQVCGFTGENPLIHKIPPALNIIFQNGPITENGVNGITQEILLEICADRLRSFQSGPFACRENAIALKKIEEAQMWLQKRTRDRMARNVEGTNNL